MLLQKIIEISHLLKQNFRLVTICFFGTILLAFGCSKNKQLGIKFYKKYSFLNASENSSFDTLKLFRKKELGTYFIVNNISDSFSEIYMVRNNGVYFFDALNCTTTKKYVYQNATLFYSKKEDIAFSEKKTLINLYACYLKDTIDLYITEIGSCVKKGGDNDFDKKPMAAWLYNRNNNITYLSFCIYPKDTIKIIENFINLEKSNLFIGRLTKKIPLRLGFL